MNCKPGDLAIVISATTTPEMIGHIVQVVRPAVPWEQFDGHIVGDFKEFSWVVNSQSADGIAVRSESGKLIYARQRVVADRYLRPISGLPDTEDTDEREPIKEVA